MPENLRDNPGQQESTTEACDYFELERSALGALLDLSADVVVPVEQEIAERYQHVQDAAKARLEHALSKSGTRYREESQAADQAYSERVSQVESEHQTALEALARSADRSLERVAAEFRAVERDAERRREDDLLMSETVVQATVNGLRKEFQGIERQVATAQQRLDALREHALQVLREYRYEPDREPESTERVPGKDLGAVCERLTRDATQHLDRLRTLSIPRLMLGLRYYGLLTVCCLAAMGLAGALSFLAIPYIPPFFVSGPIAFVAVLVVMLLVGRSLRRKAAVQIRAAHDPFRRALAGAQRASEVQLERAREELKREEAIALEKRDRDRQIVAERFETTIREAEQRRADSLRHIEETRSRRHEEIDARCASQLQEAEAEHERRHRESDQRHAQETNKAREEYERTTRAGRNEHDSARAALEAEWKRGLSLIARLLEETNRLKLPPRGNWTPPPEFSSLIPFGHWHLDLKKLAASVREHAPFLAECEPEVSVPALLTLPSRASLLLQIERTGRTEATDALRAVLLRLLTSLPPGRVRFTILDPVGLGENFAGFMHLVDYEEALVCGRIWTESEHIEARLTELTSHMENVIQKYLRNEFETIEAYNQQAGELAEPYRFLVIADFPVNFNEGAARRLNSIVSSGARCGVFTLIAHDQRQPVPPELQLDDLQSGSIHLVHDGKRFVFQDELLSQFPLTLDAPPPEEELTRILHEVGRRAKDSLRVEVPFASVAPTPQQCWTRSTRQDVTVPLGNTGAVRRQRLRLGRGIAQHALIAGKTGSGKSTLLHVMITNLALWYSPDEVEFYLVDFKKGVEFKTYVTHHLPHARAIAIESDREFGVSVLQRIDAEMARRGDLFRAAGVQDLATYREVTGQMLPRTLLIVDEFQVFFAEDDKLSQDAAILLDRLVRQGRAFGIHVLLGSQTLGGTAGLARSTIGQMAVRIALQCSEADSQLILDDTNVAARLLSRPGEAIYNDAGGLVEGNSPFQTAWLPDDERTEYLRRVRALAAERNVQRDPPVVFEGNAPASITQNRLLASILESPPGPTAAPRVWLGEAVAIKDPTSVTFRRQSGANLLLVGQREDAALATMAAAMLCLGAQHAPNAARFVVLDGRPADAPPAGGLRDVATVLPHETRFVGWRDVADAFADLARETQRRLDSDETNAPATYVFIYGLQRYRMLRRQEDDFSLSMNDDEKPPAPDKQFAELLREGPPLGVHAVVWSDTLATLERTLDRQSIGEFDNRVLFQMGASDSSNLIDTPEANKLGFYRALLYSEERGILEKFRPYAACEAEWLEHARECLGRTPT
jgi:S-DNA-T family DNA segregation ATPase FtsK/SpoIIIE